MPTTESYTQDRFAITEDFLVSHGKRVFEFSKNARDLGNIDREWQESNDLYNALFSPQERKVSEMLGVPRLFIPKTYAQLQRILEDVLEAFFFDFEEIVSVSTDKNVPKTALDAVKVLLNHRLNGHPINFYQEFFEAALDSLKNKVGIFKVYPDLKTYHEEKKGEDGKPLTDDQGNPITEERIKKWCPRIDCLPYEDVFFHSESTWKDYWKRTVVHRMKRSRDYCRRRGYKNLDQIPEDTGTPSTDSIKTQRNMNNVSPFADTQTIKPQREVWVFEFWDFLPGKDGYLVSGSYIMGGSADGPAVLLKDWEENKLPYDFEDEFIRCPIVVGSAFPEAHVMYGKDFPQITKGLQKETNAQRNQEREAVARALRAPILVDRNANIDLMALMVRKIGGVVQGDNVGPDAIREMVPNNPLGLTQGSQFRTDNDYSEISSVPPLAVGVQTPGVGSATEFAGLDRNANKKINMVVRNLAITLLIPTFQYLLKLEQRYESDEYIELVTGKRLGMLFKKDDQGNYKDVPPSMLIQGNFDLKVNLGVNKQTQLQQYRTMLELGNQANLALGQLVQFGVANPAQVTFFNPMWVFERMAPLLGQKNLEEMKIPAVPPPPQAERGGNPTPPSVSQAGSVTPEDVLAR